MGDSRGTAPKSDLRTPRRLATEKGSTVSVSQTGATSSTATEVAAAAASSSAPSMVPVGSGPGLRRLSCWSIAACHDA